MISARMIADSVNPKGVRLSTIEVTFNRYILAEVNTYREWSRNSASSRAIPVKKVLRQVWRDPAVPIHWGANQSGMQARAELLGWRKRLARRLFLLARIPILAIVWLLTKVGLHKQVANRLLEPWVWHTAIISSTTWSNMLKQRDHEDAQPEFQVLARCIKNVLRHSEPRKLEWGEWHQPYLTPEDWAAAASYELDGQIVVPTTTLMSAARCAAVSYVRQGEKRDPFKDIELAQRLAKSGHWSPFEHVARAEDNNDKISNFDLGWLQLRKFFPGEDGRDG
ncbi:MAG: hypothetical protein AB7V46_11755 [Thermomicrobiales bacterium]